MSIIVPEELIEELAAMRRLIEKLHHDIARLIQQQQITEQAARWVAPGRPPDEDDKGSD
jgi:hypothetical protein